MKSCFRTGPDVFTIFEGMNASGITLMTEICSAIRKHPILKSLFVQIVVPRN